MTPTNLPKSLTVIGSGAIGIEFANFYNALGVTVDVVELANRILPNEDEEVSEYAMKDFEKQGINFHLHTTVQDVEKIKSGCKLTIKSNTEDKTSTLKSDKVILAVGITGNIENIGLENLDIKCENGHILTNGHMQTNIENIYAIGDVTGAPWLAHKASHEGVLSICLLYTSPSPRDRQKSRMPSSA